MAKRRKIKINSDNEEIKDSSSVTQSEPQDNPAEETLVSEVEEPFSEEESIPSSQSEEYEEIQEKSLTKEELLRKELEEVKALAAENRESFLRARADYENLKKRTEQQLSNSISIGKRVVIEKLLDVLDNFERALNVDESKADVKNILIGVRMIYKQLKGVLEEEGVKVVPTVGNIFDP